jgi:glutathione S-transferase
MLEIWGRKTSSNVQALMWCVGELGLPYQRHNVGHKFGGNDTPEFLAMNPNGTVPVLRDDGGEPLWETGAILRYLATKFGDAPFWPKDLDRRTPIDKWAEWSKLNIALNFTGPIFWRVVRTAPNLRDDTVIATALRLFDASLSVAEVQLRRHAHLAAEEFTLADIQFGHVLYRYFEISIQRREHRALRRYYDRLTERPAFREHVMVPYEELRAG